jgi:hypothetical protein
MEIAHYIFTIHNVRFYVVKTRGCLCIVSGPDPRYREDGKCLLQGKYESRFWGVKDVKMREVERQAGERVHGSIALLEILQLSRAAPSVLL